MACLCAVHTDGRWSPVTASDKNSSYIIYILYAYNNIQSRHVVSKNNPSYNEVFIRFHAKTVCIELPSIYNIMENTKRPYYYYYYIIFHRFSSNHTISQ